MMAKWPEIPDASAEVERLRVELEQARKNYDAAIIAARGLVEDVLAAETRAARLQAERDDLAARLQSIQQAERTYTAAKLTEAAKMRKGEAL